MRVAFILFTLAVPSVGPAAATPPEAEYLPAQAVDHVVVMDERRADCSNCPLHRRTITRSGSWVKDERSYSDRTETIYSDFASGTSFTLHRNREGALVTLLVERNFEPEGRYGVRRRPTGRRDSGLGEPCEIWTLTTTLSQTEQESCESADGVLLWSRSHGQVSPQAVSVERRPVRPEEVRPPADLLDRVPWPRFDRAAPMGQGGYEVELTSRSRGTERTSTLLSQGSLHSSRSEDRRDEGLTFVAGDGRTSYRYQVDVRGRAVQLQAGLPRLRLNDIPARWEQVAGRNARRVLGEQCTWQINASLQSTDTHYQCRTTDGVPLMLEFNWHWDSVIDIYTARRVMRRPLTAADIAPPAAALDWASWGVTPAP
jgi:hypothetical protein